MNKDKIKILLRLYRNDLISDDEFIVLIEEKKIDFTSAPYTPILGDKTPLYDYKTNNHYYPSGGNSSGIPSNYFTTSDSIYNNEKSSTIGSTFSKKWINPEEPKF